MKTINVSVLRAFSALPLLLAMSSVALADTSLREIPEALLGNWNLQGLWDSNESKFREVEPSVFCTAFKDSIVFSKKQTRVSVGKITRFPADERGSREKLLLIMENSDVVFPLRLQSNDRGTWLLQIYDREMKEELMRATFKVSNANGQPIIGKEAVNKDPALSIKWRFDQKDITSNAIEPLDLSALPDLDERLFLFYLLAYSFKPLEQEKDLGRIKSLVSSRDLVVTRVLPYLRAGKFEPEIIEAFEATKDSCDRLLSALKKVDRIMAGREDWADRAVTGIEVDFLSGMIGAIPSALKTKGAAFIPAAGAGLAQSVKQAFGVVAQAKALSQEMRDRLDDAVKHEQEALAKIRALASVVAKKRGWRPGESGWSDESLFPNVDYSTVDGLRSTLAKLNNMMTQQPRNPFVRAAYNKCVNRLPDSATVDSLMQSASFSLEASRLVPDGDMFLVVKCAFIEVAADRIALANDILMDSLGGWGVGRSYNGHRALRVARTWRAYDAADSTSKIRLHQAWGFATYGNVPDALASLKDLADLVPMDDGELFYRLARLRAKDEPGLALQMIATAAEIAGPGVKNKARSQKEFRWIKEWNSEKFKTLVEP